ncbi:protein-disulfide isomerase [Microbacterium sp. CH12i]|uniref:DsbA family protein n=1 Tax=Microbacterium sp. CH12i TaxID=1479651 RepID=UPI0004612D76|nr:thioredoxin domain-containing protein [Microbacterium sp. CH12i]KDA05935.1 protein-disulfide isomerase [Microbacterium sp. CH12i]
MSSDETPNVPTPRSSREAVREKAQQVNARQSKARILRGIIIGAVAIIAVGAIGTAVTMAVTSSVTKPTLSPTGMDGDGIVVHNITDASAEAVPATPMPLETEAGATTDPTPEPTVTPTAVDVHIYVDYLSPGAGEFERANARQLAGWIKEDAVTVTYHPVSMLTASSNGTKYSLRSAAAAACVATHSPEQFYAFNHELLVDQPEVDSDGRSDVELADLAVAVGVDSPKIVRNCIEDGDFASWAKEATMRALDGPLAGSKDLVLTSAPMIVVNGEAYIGSLKDPAEFSQFVLTVASDTDATPTPTPTPTETPAP